MEITAVPNIPNRPLQAASTTANKLFWIPHSTTLRVDPDDDAVKCSPGHVAVIVIVKLPAPDSSAPRTEM